MDYTCKDARRDIADYYNGKKKDKRKKLDAIVRAYNHIYQGSTIEKQKISCLQCHQYLLEMQAKKQSVV